MRKVKIHKDEISVPDRGPRGSANNYKISTKIAEEQNKKKLARLGAGLKINCRHM